MGKAPMTTVFPLYFEMMQNWTIAGKCHKYKEEQLWELKQHVQEFSPSFFWTFFEQYISEWYTLMFHLQHHFLEDMGAFRRLYELHPSPFKKYSVNINQQYKRTPKSKDTFTKETVLIMACRVNDTGTGFWLVSLERERVTEKCKVSQLLRDGTHLLQGGESTSLLKISNILADDLTLKNPLPGIGPLLALFEKICLGHLLHFNKRSCKMRGLENWRLRRKNTGTQPTFSSNWFFKEFLLYP